MPLEHCVLGRSSHIFGHKRQLDNWLYARGEQGIDDLGHLGKIEFTLTAGGAVNNT